MTTRTDHPSRWHDTALALQKKLDRLQLEHEQLLSSLRRIPDLCQLDPSARSDDDFTRGYDTALAAMREELELALATQTPPDKSPTPPAIPDQPR